MAEIGKERWGQYKRNVLEILRDHPEGLHWKDLFAELDKIMPANEFESLGLDQQVSRASSIPELIEIIQKTQHVRCVGRLSHMEKNVLSREILHARRERFKRGRK